MNSQSTPKTQKELLAFIAKGNPSASESVLDIVYKVGTYVETTSAIPSINAAIESIMQESNDLSDDKKSRHIKLLLNLSTFLDEIKASADWFKSQSYQGMLDDIQEGGNG